MADVYQNEIGKLFNQSVFDIPKYQRGYSWTSQEVNDFISDLEYTYEEKKTEKRNQFSHYFGTVVLLDKGTHDAGNEVFDFYDVIDGQQRMTTVSVFMSCLNSELNYISDAGSVSDDYSMSPAKTAEENAKTFVSYHSSERITLDSLNNSVYQSITIHNDSPSNIETKNLSQRRLIECRETIEDWFRKKRSEYIQDDDYNDYYDYLQEIGKIVKKGLEVTTYIIEDETEAGRLFEVVNDRGKDLTTLDRIKSYLVYCASRMNDNDLARKIFDRFGTVLENVTRNGGDDSEIDAFIRYHWTLFSGEVILAKQSNSEYTTVHRRVKNMAKHASTDQKSESLIKWIELYLESIIKCSEAFANLENPRSISVNDSSLSEKKLAEVIERLDGLNRLPVSRNFLPLLMATYRQYGIGDEFHQVVTLCEKLSFRVYNIAGRRTDAGRAALQRHGYWIEWAGRQEDANDIFNNDPNALEFNSLEQAINSTCEMLESQMGSNAPDTYFTDCLRRKDVFEGSARSDGWRGVRNKEVVRYLLYKYEKHLRESDEKASLSQIPPFSTWKEQGITIEHVHPQSSNSEREIDEYTDMLGNLVLLGPEDNSSASNADYSEKYEQTYAASNMQSLAELPDPKDGWGVNDIKNRTDDIIRFALSEWGGLSKIHLHVKNTPNSILGYREIANSIRQYHRSNHGFTVPSVQFSEDSADSDNGWQRVNDCPSCGGMWAELKSPEQDGWDARCAGCGSDIENPIYHFKFSSYIEKRTQSRLQAP
jgi:hypothetical protein